MGDAKAGPVRLSFNRQLRVEFRGATVTSDAGAGTPRRTSVTYSEMGGMVGWRACGSLSSMRGRRK